MMFSSRLRRLAIMAAALGATALSGCGGGSSTTAGSAQCDLDSQKNWLRSHMLDSYFWSGASPNPEPAAYDTLQKYFDALRYAGAGAVPADRWSYISDSASYNQFFGEGREAFHVATTAPSNEFNVETKGCGWPVGHAVR